MTAWAFILLLFVFKNVFKKDKFVKMSEKSINCHLLCYQKFIDRLSRNILIDILCICITYKARIAFLIVLSLNDLLTIPCKSYGGKVGNLNYWTLNANSCSGSNVPRRSSLLID